MEADRIITRKEIIAHARTWVDTPYRHQGRVKGKAIDCIGMVWGVWNDLGLPAITIPANYTESPRGDMVLRNADAHLVAVDRPMAPGDVVVLWGFSRDEPQHFAIVGEYGSRLTMIHAFSKRGKVVEHGWEPFWQKRFVRAYEFPGSEAV